MPAIFSASSGGHGANVSGGCPNCTKCFRSGTASHRKLFSRRMFIRKFIEFNLDYYFTPLKWTHLWPCPTILFLRYDLKRTTTKTKLRIVTFCPRQPNSQNDHHSNSIANDLQHDSLHAMDALVVYCDVLPSFYLLSTTLALCHRIVQETHLNLPCATSFSSQSSLYDCLQGHIGPSHSSQPSSYDVMLVFSCSKASDLDVDVIRVLCKLCSAIDVVC